MQALDLLKKSTKTKSNNPVVVLEPKTNTLLNRYRHGKRVATESVLLQDDDVRYSRGALRAFAAGHALFPDHVLGARRHLSSQSTELYGALFGLRVDRALAY